MSADLKLKCLELAMTQAKMEVQHGNINRVVEIATQFYNHITAPDSVASPGPEAVLETQKPGRTKKADKPSPIFE